MLLTLEWDLPPGWRPSDPFPDLPMPEAEERIGPGSLIWIEGPDLDMRCTANFIWEDANGTRYLGTAGHCLMPSGVHATHGRDADFDASDVRVHALLDACPALANCQPGMEDQQWVELGGVAYARQGVVGTDIGLVRLPPSVHEHLRFEMPVWGGPVGPGVLLEGEPLGHYGYGFAFNTFPETRGRIGAGLGPTVSDIGVANPFAFVGTVSGGDSGSAAVTLRAADDGVLRGEKAIGVITHVTPPSVLGVAFGTQVSMAQTVFARDLCLKLRVLPGGEFPEGVAASCVEREPAEIPTVELLEKDLLTFTSDWAEVREVRLVAEQAFQVTRLDRSPTEKQIGTVYFAVFPEGALQPAPHTCGAIPDDWTWMIRGHGVSAPDENPLHPPGNYTMLAASETPTRFRIDFDGEFEPFDLIFPPEQEYRRIDAGVSELQVTFPLQATLERSSPAPATLGFHSELATDGPGIFAASFAAQPFASAGNYEITQGLAQGGQGGCTQDADGGVVLSHPTGSTTAGSQHGPMTSLLSGTLPGPAAYDWTGAFSVSAGTWNSDATDAKIHAALLTLPGQ